jgi:hypothetical protein
MAHSLPETRGPAYDFDFYADPILQKDVLGGYMQLKQNAPPVFWTPRNGGHWVVTSTNGVIAALRHPEIYSSKFLSISPSPNQQRMIPDLSRRNTAPIGRCFGPGLNARRSHRWNRALHNGRKS